MWSACGAFLPCRSALRTVNLHRRKASQAEHNSRSILARSHLSTRFGVFLLNTAALPRSRVIFGHTFHIDFRAAGMTANCRPCSERTLQTRPNHWRCALSGYSSGRTVCRSFDTDAPNSCRKRSKLRRKTTNYYTCVFDVVRATLLTSLWWCVPAFVNPVGTYHHRAVTVPSSTGRMRRVIAASGFHGVVRMDE